MVSCALKNPLARPYGFKNLQPRKKHPTVTRQLTKSRDFRQNYFCDCQDFHLRYRTSRNIRISNLDLKIYSLERNTRLWIDSWQSLETFAKIISVTSSSYTVTSVLRIRDAYLWSWILIFVPTGSRIPDPKTQQKRGMKKYFVVLPFFVATNITKLKNILFLNWCRKIFGPIYKEL
jgi:hypothetical protein